MAPTTKPQYPTNVTHESLRLYDALIASLKREAELQELLAKAIETINELNDELAKRT